MDDFDRKLAENISKAFFVAGIIALILIIVTQYKIEKYNSRGKKFQGPNFSTANQDTNQAGNYCGENNKNGNRILAGIIFVFVFGVVIWLVNIHLAHNEDGFYTKYLSGLVTVQFFNLIFIPMLFIFRTENLYLFFKSEILKILKLFICKLPCQQRRIEPTK